MASAKQFKISFKCSPQFQVLVGGLRISPLHHFFVFFFLLVDYFPLKTFSKNIFKNKTKLFSSLLKEQWY